MAGKSTTPSCCLTLPLVLEKWQMDRLSKRLEIARQIYNSLLNYELKKLKRLEDSEEYRSIQNELREMFERQADDPVRKKELYNRRNDLRKHAGFTEYSFKSDMSRFYKHFNDNIGSSVAVHGIAAQVWNAFDQYLYRNGREVHFRKRGELNSVRGYSDSRKSGGAEIMFRGQFIEWKSLRLPIKLDPENEYEAQMLGKRVKYCRIVRRTGRRKDRWYVQLTLEGTPVIKCSRETGEVLHPVGHGPVGLDIGPQTIAISAQSEVSLLELADQVSNIEKEKRKLQRQMDRSRRATNPDNYHDDGTIRRGVKLTHNKSKRYRQCQRTLAYLQYQQAEIRKRQHTELANHLLSLGDRFYVEDMAWPALAHRARQTAISEKTGRYKRKKRFGKSIANKAPASLIGILNLKLLSRGLHGVYMVPLGVKASQFNHITREYQKKELSQRWNEMPDGRRIQRDMYSAFLLQHIDETTEEYDLEALDRDYEQFVVLHDQMIELLRSAPKTVASMGVVRTASEQND